ncbi:MAG: RIP metalloprotease RseP [Thermoanaerobaculia bacterium]
MHISTNILAFVFVLSFLIFFHESGHFLVAKLFRFPIEIFSIGFGKRLFGWKRNGTDYRVSLVPLGGYVKIVGLGPDESDVVAGESTPVMQGTRWQRFLVLLAGPAVNLVLALLLTAAAFAIGREVPKYLGEPPIVTMVDPGSPAEHAGFLAGDRITTLSGNPVSTWEDVIPRLSLASREKIVVEVQRGPESLNLVIVPLPKTKEQKQYDIGYTGLSPNVPAVIYALAKGYPGEKAGLKVGDRIVSIDGKPVVLYFQVVHQIKEATANFAEQGARALDVVVERAGKKLTIPIVPRKEGSDWRIGFTPFFETVKVKLAPLDALRASWTENVRMTTAVGQTIKRMVSGSGSIRQLSGPVDIARFSGDAVRTGLATLLGFMGLLSLQLGLLNLLPIPLLDGGQLFILTLEGIVRRDFSLKLKERLLQAGFVFLVLLMVSVLAFDIAKNLGF